MTVVFGIKTFVLFFIFLNFIFIFTHCKNGTIVKEIFDKKLKVPYSFISTFAHFKTEF